MGIEQFFSSMRQRENIDFKTHFINKNPSGIKVDNIFIDFNSIIHVTSQKIIQELNSILIRLITKTKDKIFEELTNKYDISKDLSIEEFKELLTLDKLNNIISNKVINYVTKEILSKVTDVKLIYIAVDGVPSRGKMAEQKKRRYMGAVMSEIRNRLKMDHNEEINKDDVRREYEKYKISWSKSNISPGTEFMRLMDIYLKGPKLEVAMKICQPTLTKYIYSGVFERGEGEKKIVNWIWNNPSKAKTIIYSPDSDVTLLSLLISEKVGSIKLLRWDQQNHVLESIDIDKLKVSFIDYLEEKSKNKIKNRQQVIDDIVFIFTMFGNDFLPKIESLSVKNDFTRLMDIYVNLKNKPLIVNDKKNKGKKSISWECFIEFFKILQRDEHKSLHLTYMSHNYRNFKTLKKLLNATNMNFMDKMSKFLSWFRTFNYAIRKKDSKLLDTQIKNKDYMIILERLTKLKGYGNEKDSFIDRYKSYYETMNKFPRVFITFQKFTKKLDDRFHLQKLSNVHSYLKYDLPILDYDKEIYKFENMLDEYKDILNAHELELGKIYIDPFTKQWRADSIKQGIRRYYYDFFGIKSLNVKDVKMNKLVKHYLEGIIWVFNYYYNWYDIKENHDVALTWWYRYSRSPLLAQIYDYLTMVKSDGLYGIDKQLMKFREDEKTWFNCYEHLFYVSPMRKLDYLVTAEYKSFVSTKFYNDLDKVVGRILGKNGRNDIDCRGIIFLTKCILFVVFKDTMNEKQFLKEFRKIKPSSKANQLAGYWTEKPNVKIISYSNKKLSLKDRKE